MHKIQPWEVYVRMNMRLLNKIEYKSLHQDARFYRHYRAVNGITSHFSEDDWSWETDKAAYTFLVAKGVMFPDVPVLKFHSAPVIEQSNDNEIESKSHWVECPDCDHGICICDVPF